MSQRLSPDKRPAWPREGLDSRFRGSLEGVKHFGRNHGIVSQPPVLAWAGHRMEWPSAGPAGVEGSRRGGP